MITTSSSASDPEASEALLPFFLWALPDLTRRSVVGDVEAALSFSVCSGTFESELMDVCRSCDDCDTALVFEVPRADD
ncbi:hypothetical protein MRB53_039805 [Persea americana]|nr:hypothetical protein MRB53_039805 [Persea americana]